MSQQVEFAKQALTFKCGTGKDAKIFIKFMVKNEDGETAIYNIPLLTLNTIQVFTTTPKAPRYCFGSANPQALSKGIRRVNGQVSAVTLNETIGSVIRRKLKGYKPVEAKYLNLDDSGAITLEQLDELTHLDQLPSCQINIFLQSPETGRVFSKSVYGVTFVNEAHSIGTSAAMGEQYSFIAKDIGPLKKEEISSKIESDEILI